MGKNELQYTLRFVVPQLFTGCRALLGAWSLFLAIAANLDGSALLLIAGLITDRLDGMLAKKLDVTSMFGYRFDCFADYLFYTAVPVVLAYRLAGSPETGWLLAALSAPFLTAAIRQARNIGWSERECYDITGFPGLPTLVYAYYIVALVFLQREGELSAAVLPAVLGITTPVFAGMSLAPLRYPKLAIHAWFLVPVVAGLNLMPFFLTTPLAWATLGLGTAYVLFAPLSMRKKEAACLSEAKS